MNKLDLLPGDPNTIAEIIQTFSGPKLERVNGGVFTTAQIPVFQIGAANVASIHATLYKMPPDQTILRLLPKTGPEELQPEVVKDWKISVPDPRPGGWNSFAVDIGMTLRPGHYTLALEAPWPERYSPSIVFEVSNYSLEAKHLNRGASEIMIRHHATGAPLAKARVTCFSQAADFPVRARDLTTDATGRVTIPTGDSGNFVLQVGDEAFLFNAERSVRHSAQIFGALLPLAGLHPGERAELKICALRYRLGDLVGPAQPVRFTAKLGEQVLRDETVLKFDDTSIAPVAFPIPQDAKPGMLDLALTTVQDGATNPTTWIAAVPIAAPSEAPASRPAISSQLLSAPSSPHPGEEAVLRIQFAQPDGHPLADTPLQCTFRYSMVDPRDNFPREKVRAIDEWSKALVQHPIETKTDQHGVAEFRLHIHPEAENASVLSAYITCLAGGTGEPLATWGSNISPHGRLLAEVAPLQLHEIGKPWTASATVVDGSDAPTRFKGEVRLVEKRQFVVWRDPAGNVVTDPDTKRYPGFHRMDFMQQHQQGWRQLDWGFTDTIIATQPMSSRDGRITTKFRLPHSGIFQVQFWQEGSQILSPHGRDRFGLTAMGPVIVGVATQDKQPYDGSFLANLVTTIKPERNLSPTMARTDRALRKLANYQCRTFHIPLTKEELDAENNGAFVVRPFLAGQRLPIGLGLNGATLASLSLTQFLDGIQFYDGDDFATEEFNRSRSAPAAPIPDKRLWPVQDGIEYGYNPEVFDGIILSPVDYMDPVEPR